MAFIDWLLVTLSGVFYFIVGLTIEYYLPLTVLLIICAHAASGGNWVLSTVLTQTWVEDEVHWQGIFYGYVIARLVCWYFHYAAGYLVEYHELSLKSGFISFSIMMLCGVIFTIWRPDNHGHSS